MTAIDIILALLVGGGAIVGFNRGFVQEMLSLLAWVLAIVAVRLFHDEAAAWLTEPVGTAAGASVAAFALVFGGVFLLGKWAAKSLGERSRRSFVGSIDRMLGAGFGVLKGLIIASVGFLLLNLVYDLVYGEKAARPTFMTDSRSYPALNATSAAMTRLIDAQRDQDESGSGSSPQPRA